MSAAVQVLAIRKLDGKTAVKAFVDLQLGGVKVMGAKIVQQDGKPPWLAMPAVKNDRGWQNVVELSQPLRERVTEVVLEVWKSRRPQQQQDRQARPSPRETPGGAVLDAAPYSRRREECPRDPGQHDTGDPARPFDDECPF